EQLEVRRAEAEVERGLARAVAGLAHERSPQRSRPQDIAGRSAPRARSGAAAGRDERPGAHAPDEEALRDQPLVRVGDGVAGGIEPVCGRARGRQTLAGAQPPVEDRLAELKIQLAREAAAPGERDVELHVPRLNGPTKFVNVGAREVPLGPSAA